MMDKSKDRDGKLDLDDLRERAEERATTGRGGLSDEEMAAVTAALQSPADPHTHYKLLRILGYAGEPSYKYVVEPFLAGPEPGPARTALWVLCKYWYMTSEYIEQVRIFMLGVPWDEVGECRVFAMGIAEGYLTETLEPRLLGAFVDIYEDENVQEEVRYHALDALRHILGQPDAPDFLVLQRAKELL